MKSHEIPIVDDKSPGSPRNIRQQTPRKAACSALLGLLDPSKKQLRSKPGFMLEHLEWF
jgi:hypothetical protein